MPFDKQIWLDSNTAIQLWELNESPVDLLPWLELKADEKKQLESLKNTKRQAEYLATRILLKKVFPNETISYSNIGAPCLTNPYRFISVAHSRKYVCLMHSDQPCGVDIETVDSKALRIAKRFLGESEFKFISDEQPGRDATLLWSAKESLYKLLKKEGVAFSKQLIIHSIGDNGQKRIVASIITEQAYTNHELMYEFIGDQVLTWIIDENNECNAHR